MHWFVQVWHSADIWMISTSWSYRRSQESKAGSSLKQKEEVHRPGSLTRAWRLAEKVEAAQSFLFSGACAGIDYQICGNWMLVSFECKSFEWQIAEISTFSECYSFIMSSWVKSMRHKQKVFFRRVYYSSKKNVRKYRLSYTLYIFIQPLFVTLMMFISLSDTMTWSLPKTAGPCPSPRSQHSSNVIGNQ